MYLTVEEAKKKCCPFAFGEKKSVFGFPAKEGDPDCCIHKNPTLSQCIGDMCMAWRWLWGHFRISDGSLVKHGESYTEKTTCYKPSKFGYCSHFPEPHGLFIEGDIKS